MNRSYRLKEQEIIEAFPEAEEIIPLKLREWEEAKADVLELRVKPFLKKIRQIEDDFARWFYREAFKILFCDELKDFNQHILRLKRLQYYISLKRGVGGINEDKDFSLMMEKARNIPILDVVADLVNLKKSGKKYSASCPFHQDKRPSFYIYPETNSFYCFGCLKGGDSIKFIEFYLSKDFKSAVKYLTGGR